MSGPDGYEAARRIRVQERVRGGHARFIAMTSHAMSGDRERYLDAGMGDHVSKPVRRKALELSIAQPPWLPSFCNTEQMS